MTKEQIIKALVGKKYTFTGTREEIVETKHESTFTIGSVERKEDAEGMLVYILHADSSLFDNSTSGIAFVWEYQIEELIKNGVLEREFKSSCELLTKDKVTIEKV